MLNKKGEIKNVVKTEETVKQVASQSFRYIEDLNRYMLKYPEYRLVSICMISNQNVDNGLVAYFEYEVNRHDAVEAVQQRDTVLYAQRKREAVAKMAKSMGHSFPLQYPSFSTVSADLGDMPF